MYWFLPFVLQWVGLIVIRIRCWVSVQALKINSFRYVMRCHCCIDMNRSQKNKKQSQNWFVSFMKLGFNELLIIVGSLPFLV